MTYTTKVAVCSETRRKASTVKNFWILNLVLRKKQLGFKG
jgi:hypothetical protein